MAPLQGFLCVSTVKGSLATEWLLCLLTATFPRAALLESVEPLDLSSPLKEAAVTLKHWGEMLPVFHSQAELSTCHYARSASLSALLYSNLSSALPPSQGTCLVRGNLTQDFHLNPGNQIFSPGALLHCWFLNLLLWSIFSEGGKG